MNLSNITILKIHGVDYNCIITGISKSETVNILQKTDLTLTWVGGWVEGNFTPSWFSLNNSKTVRAVTLELYIGQNSDGGISDFLLVNPL